MKPLLRIFTILGCLATSVLSAGPAIDIKLEGLGNSTHMRASVTNLGSDTIKLLSKGTVLDNDAVEKFKVYSPTGRVKFAGIKKRIRLTDLSDNSFTILAPNQTVTMYIDLARLHDLSSGGPFKVVTEGAIPFADVNSTSVAGKALPFRSNVLELDVEGRVAEEAKSAFKSSFQKRARLLSNYQKRAKLLSDCKAEMKTADAIRTCSGLARAAANASVNGSVNKFYEYFKTTSLQARQLVSERFHAVATECQSSVSGKVSIHCVDIFNYCDNDVLAYTVPSDNVNVYCPLFYSFLKVLSQKCHDQDQATTTLHELTHAPVVFQPATDDYAYGYDAINKLNSVQALRNADTFAMYANAIYVGC